MEFKINSSPHLKMSEVTKRLFNRNFHSDVQFIVEGKIIYAHSLELMKRSIVFEQQLEDTMGETKLIPILNCKYEDFYDFIRFIYTDECQINDKNGIELLKLAVKYKVIVLENQVLSYGKSPNWVLKCFEHSVRENYEMPRNFINTVAAWNLALCFKSEQYTLLHVDVVDELSKIDRVRKDVSESMIFNAVANWIDSYCTLHKMTLSEARQQFDKLIKNIRFPTMSNEEIRGCINKYPNLLTEDDCISIGKQTIFGGSVWSSKHRDELNSPRTWRTFKCGTNFENIFSVNKCTVLHGLRIGIEKQRKPIRIEIFKTNKRSETIILERGAPSHWNEMIIELGDSLELKPKFQYTINIKYLEIGNQDLAVDCRTESVDVIINDSDKKVKIIKTSPNMKELFFKSP